jgi:hypothetical protein
MERLWIAGNHISEIASQMRRTVKGVYMRAMRVGLLTRGVRPRFWTEIRKQEFKAMWDDNVPSIEIAEKLGCSQITIQHSARRFGFACRRLANTWWSDERFTRAKELAANGYSASMIGIEIGCGRGAVIGKLRRAGISCACREHMAIHLGRATSRRTPRSKSKIKLPSLPRSSQETRKQNSARALALGHSKTSAGYRKHAYEHAGEMTKTQLREMLTAAVANTAAIEIKETSV